MIDNLSISVVIPTRNRAATIGEKARWVLGQAHVTQLVVVVDGSTDDTAERLAAIGDRRLEVIHNSVSTGPARAKNAGLARVTGAWIATLDDDDEHSVNFLGALQQVAIEESADVVCAPWLNVTDGRDPDDAFHSAIQSGLGPLPGSPSAVPSVPFVETIWGPSNFLFKRELVDAGIRFDARFRYNYWREETSFLVAAARAGFRVGTTNSAYSFVSQRSSGGIDRRSLGYEMWTVLNDAQFMMAYGAWMKRNGYVTSRTAFVLRNALLRARGRLRPVISRLTTRGTGR